MVDQEILAYYECNDERGRLAAGRQRIEFLRVWELLERFLPSPPAAVLDVGGAAGRYSVPLAAAGYEVRLVDPVPVLVAQAEQAAREAGVPLAAEAGDARSLPAADDSADAVLLFGPLYHLTDSADRVTALPEARRVTRPGGIVMAIGLPRYYPLFENLVAGGSYSAEDNARFLAEGQYRDPMGDDRRSPGMIHGFTTSYFHRPEDLAAEVAAAGLSLDRIRGGHRAAPAPRSGAVAARR